MGFSFGDIFDFIGGGLEEALPDIITGGVGLIAQDALSDAEKDKTDTNSIEYLRERGQLENQLAIERAKMLKELGLTGGGGGGSRQQANPAAWRDAQAQRVSAKLAQAQVLKEAADQLAGRMNQAILSRRR